MAACATATASRCSIDARKLGHLVDRTRRELSDEVIARIAGSYHAWRGEPDAGDYADEPGFCKAATLDEIRAHSHVLTPGRYVGAAAVEEDDVSFVERFAELQVRLKEQFKGDVRLQGIIRNNLARLGTTLGTDTGDDA